MDTTAHEPAAAPGAGDTAGRMPTPTGHTTAVRRIAPAFGLFLVSPLIGEYLLGNISISGLWLMLWIAPLYGGGAVLVREVGRRSGGGWPSLVLLGLAYAVVEEGLATQTLFNPSYYGYDLLSIAHIDALGIGAWWTLFVLTLHTVWSISVSIALVEALAPRRRTTPWLGVPGLMATAVVFLLGVAITFSGNYDEERFVASTPQLLGTAVVVVGLVLTALAVARRPRPGRERPAPSPSPWSVGAASLIAASVFLALSLVVFGLGPALDWVVVGVYVGLDAVVIVLVATWSRRAGWGEMQRVALAGGALLAYAWYGFPSTPLLGATGTLDLVGNAVFALAAVALLAAAVVTARERRSAP